MAEIVQNKKQPGVIFLKGKAYYNKGKVEEVSDSSSSLSVIKNPSKDMVFVDFDNDNRFELSYNDKGGEWHQRDLFQDANENNMYSPATAPPDYNVTEFYIKNITSKPIYFKLCYDRDTEGPTYDYGLADIRQLISMGRENTIFNGYDIGQYYETDIYCLPSQYVLTLAFREDSGGRQGKDNVGFTMYEVKEE